jgi:3-methyladenine DNA glycosylase AlkC
MPKSKHSLKDQLYNPIKVKHLANEIKAVYADFDASAFEIDVVEKFPSLELKERMYHIRDMLGRYLPCDYEEALAIILKALPKPLDNSLGDDDFGDFIYAPYGEFVALHGCNGQYLADSLSALSHITKRFSVEFAIREFINLYPTQTIAMLERCANSPYYHQRRLASEGLRPKLPWAKKLTLEYQKALPFLDRLFEDETRYVTRSVANHLNDIAKIDAPFVIKTLKSWQTSKRQNEKEMAYINSHALRTLVKQGNIQALEMLGYTTSPRLELTPLSLAKEKIKVGEYLEFNFKIEAKEEMHLMIDYIIYFQNKKQKRSPKVFKLKKIKLAKGECIIVSKKHLFKIKSSTRTYYEGEHKIALQINGVMYKGLAFLLLLI